MKSLVDLMNTIIAIPSIDVATKLRAGFLLSQFKGTDPLGAFGDMFGIFSGLGAGKP